MNLLLFESGEIERGSEGATELRLRLIPEDRRFVHVSEILNSAVGDRLLVGELGGRLGHGLVEEISAAGATIRIESLDREPPAATRLRLVLALPRPPMLRRLLQAVTTLGVKEIVLMGSRRVEKSFWQSSVLETESVVRHLRLGLEQAIDTVEPTVELRRRFRPLVEDELAMWARTETVLVADPSYDAGALAAAIDRDEQERLTLVVGPEGGFIPFELELLRSAGISGVGLGERILRVETAVLVLLGKLLS